MNDCPSVELQALIDRLREGDRDAGRFLLERAHGRLRKLARRILTDSFPYLQYRHELDSVVHDCWLRLSQALEKANPPTVADFFRLAAHKIRQVLLDMVDRERRRAREANAGGSFLADQPDETYDPARLAAWTELHRQVAALPEPERSVFELHYYLGVSQAEIAQILGLHPRKVSHLWVAATDRLSGHLSGAADLL